MKENNSVIEEQDSMLLVMQLTITIGYILLLQSGCILLILVAYP
jgi:hypothetical protein